MDRHSPPYSKDRIRLTCVGLGALLLILIHCPWAKAQSTDSKAPPPGFEVSPVLSTQGQPKSEWTETDPFSFRSCQHILFLLDCSFSMRQKIHLGLDGKKVMTRLEVAKSLIRAVLSSLPKDTSCGLRIFGAELADLAGSSVDEQNPHLAPTFFAPELSCRKTELVVPLHAGNRQLILKALDQIKALGQMTNLEYALRQTYDDCDQKTGEIAIILVTDGQDTCGGNPAQFIAHTDPNRQISLVVASFASRGERAFTRQLTSIAGRSKGKYFDVSEFGQLVNDVKEAFSKE